MTTVERLRAAKGLLTVAQISEAIGSHPQTIYKWVYADTIPYLRVGARVKFDGAIVANWLEKRSRT